MLRFWVSLIKVYYYRIVFIFIPVLLWHTYVKVATLIRLSKQSLSVLENQNLLTEIEILKEIEILVERLLITNFSSLLEKSEWNRSLSESDYPAE